MERFRNHGSLLGLCGFLVVGCVHTPPPELLDARTAYKKASGSIAAQETPAQLHTAESALGRAEQHFVESGDDDQTRDLAYVAMRAAQRAEVEATAIKNEKALAQLEGNKERADTKELSTLRGQSEEHQRMLTTAETGRREADERAMRANAELMRIAAVRQDERGTVITLSGEVLFTSGKAVLLPGAQAKLKEVAAALTQQDPGATIIVEGHTDTQGSRTFNLELSTRRAQAVCDYLAMHGVERERIRAQGLGFSRPLGDNKTAEGRANNRRVEIVVSPAAAAVTPGG